MPITVDATGVSAPALTDAIEEARERFREVFGVDLAPDAQTPQEQLAAILGLVGTEFAEALIGVANATSTDYAAGEQLDAIGSTLGISRRPATSSRVTATARGVAGTVVPAGSRARTAAGAVFATSADAVLSPAGVDVAMVATATGPVVAAAGELSAIVTVIAGWESITNGSAAVLGRARQTDPDYRLDLRERSAHNGTGPLAALRGAVLTAEATRVRVAENATSAAVTVQEWPLAPHSLLVVAAGGTDADVTRAVETHRGLGCATVTAIRGGAPDEAALGAVTAGSVTWRGTAYPGLDLSAAASGAARAAALSALLPADVSIAFIDARYVAAYGWTPDGDPEFGDGSVEIAFGLAPDPSSAAPGPFVRVRERALTVTLAVTRGDGFPADGLERIRAAVGAVVSGYGVGAQAWANDVLAAAEGVAGTRVTAIAVQYASADASGVAVPLDTSWSLPAANLTITIT